MLFWGTVNKDSVPDSGTPDVSSKSWLTDSVLQLGTQTTVRNLTPFRISCRPRAPPNICPTENVSFRIMIRALQPVLRKRTPSTLVLVPAANAAMQEHRRRLTRQIELPGHGPERTRTRWGRIQKRRTARL